MLVPICRKSRTPVSLTVMLLTPLFGWERLSALSCWHVQDFRLHQGHRAVRHQINVFEWAIFRTLRQVWLFWAAPDQRCLPIRFVKGKWQVLISTHRHQQSLLILISLVHLKLVKAALLFTESVDHELVFLVDFLLRADALIEIQASNRWCHRKELATTISSLHRSTPCWVWCWWKDHWAMRSVCTAHDLAKFVPVEWSL